MNIFSNKCKIKSSIIFNRPCTKVSVQTFINQQHFSISVIMLVESSSYTCFLLVCMSTNVYTCTYNFIQYLQVVAIMLPKP